MSIYANHLFEPGTKNNSWAHLYEYVKKGDRVLDIGCSTGYFGEALMHLKQCEVWGVDIDEADIREAGKRLTNALVLDINDTRTYSKLGTFDVIIFADVIEHLIDPRTTLKSVKKLLNPAGKVIFSIPHMAHSSVRIDLLKGKFPYKNRGLLDNTHLHFYDMDETESVFTESGYTITQLDPVIARYPRGVMAEKLAGTGIDATKKLETYFTETDGDIFQIVGCAQPRSKKTVVPLRDVDYVMPQDEMYNFIQRLEQENTQLRHQLEQTYASVSWRLTRPLRRVGAKAKGLKKNRS